jgi:hypothetical protein
VGVRVQCGRGDTVVPSGVTVASVRAVQRVRVSWWEPGAVAVATSVAAFGAHGVPARISLTQPVRRRGLTPRTRFSMASGIRPKLPTHISTR